MPGMPGMLESTSLRGTNCETLTGPEGVVISSSVRAAPPPVVGSWNPPHGVEINESLTVDERIVSTSGEEWIVIGGEEQRSAIARGGAHSTQTLLPRDRTREGEMKN